MEYIRKLSLKQYIKNTISAPIIYWAFFWFLMLDIIIEIYHRICFPLYGIEIVDRKKYIKFDRHRLGYLRLIDKFNCLYCAYGNWLINYVREIVARTEKHWCGIKHADDSNFIVPEHHKDFISYWDEEAFKERYLLKCKLGKN